MQSVGLFRPTPGESFVIMCQICWRKNTHTHTNIPYIQQTYTDNEKTFFYKIKFLLLLNLRKYRRFFPFSLLFLAVMVAVAVMPPVVAAAVAVVALDVMHRMCFSKYCNNLMHSSCRGNGDGDSDGDPENMW